MHLEDRFNVRLSGLYAFEVDDDTGYVVHINGEVHVAEGDAIDEHIHLVAVAYDEQGRVLGSQFTYFGSAKFLCFDVFSLELELPVSPSSLPVFSRSG